MDLNTLLAITIFHLNTSCYIFKSTPHPSSARYCLDIAELSVSCEGNPSDVSQRYLRNIARTKRDILRISLALLLHNTVTALPWLLSCFRDVHKVCNWDEKGPQKVYKALKDEVTWFIRQVQEVSHVI